MHTTWVVLELRSNSDWRVVMANYVMLCYVCSLFSCLIAYLWHRTIDSIKYEYSDHQSIRKISPTKIFTAERIDDDFHIWSNNELYELLNDIVESLVLQFLCWKINAIINERFPIMLQSQKSKIPFEPYEFWRRKDDRCLKKINAINHSYSVAYKLHES